MAAFSLISIEMPAFSRCGVDCLDCLAPELFPRLLRPLSKFDQRLPCAVAVLRLVGSGGEADPFFAVLFVLGAVVQHEPDARELEIHEAAQRVFLIGTKFDAANHGAASCWAMASSAHPSGELARPRASRSNACLIVSSGTPCCRAIEQTIAQSFAIESECEPTLALPMKISASRPSGYLPIVAK